MINSIYVGDGILEQIKNFGSCPNIITKESVFNYWMQEFKNHPYSIEWDYEKFIRNILDYYE